MHWDRVGPLGRSEFLAFVTTFPDADMRELRERSSPAKLRYLRRMISGDIFMTINGVRQPLSEADVKRMHGEVATWEQIGTLLGKA